MKYLRSFYKRHRGMAALALFLLLGQVVGTLLIPALIANVVDPVSYTHLTLPTTERV